MTDNRIKTIADANGFYTLLSKVVEECAELTTEIARYQNDDDGMNYKQIFEEAADVMIVVEQLRHHEPTIFDETREFKINRQLERMGKQC